jgi:hypothetical protein
MLTPGDNCATQPASFPLPLPIRDPATFFVIGKCGKRLNHTLRDVLSDLLDAFFIKSLYRSICFALTHKGCKIRSPKWPYAKDCLRKFRNFRCLCLFLKVNFLGLNDIYIVL